MEGTAWQRTSTGCTTATSFLDGAGWYFDPSSAKADGGKCSVEPSTGSRLRNASDKVEDIDNRC